MALAEQSLRSAPLLVQRFDDLRKAKQIPWEKTWQKNQPLFSSENDLREYVVKVKQSFDFIYSHQRFVAAIDALPSENSKTYLKTVRKYGLIYKNTFQFLTANHFAPPELHLFLKALGKLNDAVSSETDFTVQKQQALSLAQKLENLPELSPQAIGTIESFQEYARKEQAEISELLEQEELDVTQFHDLRKALRAFMNLFQIPAAEALRSPAHDIFLQLYDLSRLLGDTHDEAVKNDLQGIKLYAENKYALNPLLRKRIFAAMNSVARALQLERPST